MPDNVDAALALPAHSYSGRERVYFFKGTQGVGGRLSRQWSSLGFLSHFTGDRPQHVPTPYPHLMLGDPNFNSLWDLQSGSGPALLMPTTPLPRETVLGVPVPAPAQSGGV